MKKVIIICGLTAIATVTAFADRSPDTIYCEVSAMTNENERIAYRKAINANEWRAVADYIVALAATNKPVSGKVFNDVGIAWAVGNPLNQFPNTIGIESEVDDKLSGAGLTAPLTCYARLPKTAEVMLNSTNEWCKAMVGNRPVRVAITRRTKDGYPKLNKGIPLAEMLNLLAEDVSQHSFRSFGMQSWGSNLGNRKSELLGAASGIVKKELRKQGKSFVVQPGGLNPVQEAIDQLTAALDAPKMAGVSAWVATWCPDYTWVEPDWPSAEVVAATKEKLLYGEIPFDDAAKFGLCAWLGVTEYNKFVREYNGEQ